MYKSPIDIETETGNIQMQVDGLICRAVQTIKVNVDKEELLKALQYDRGQYDKGYKDGIKGFAERIKQYLLLDNYGETSVVSFEDIENIVDELGGC